MRYVYLLRTQGDYYKVGIANDVAKRIKTLQTANPERIELVACRLVDLAEILERRIHSMLQEFAATGGKEWFKLTPAHALKVCVQMNTAAIVEPPEFKPRLTDEQLRERAIEIFRLHGRASTSLLQRSLSIGYNKAASIVEALEDDGVVSSADGNRARQLLEL